MIRHERVGANPRRRLAASFFEDNVRTPESPPHFRNVTSVPRRDRVHRTPVQLVLLPLFLACSRRVNDFTDPANIEPVPFYVLAPLFRCSPPRFDPRRIDIRPAIAAIMSLAM